ncbi:Imm51 family immunity protein [Acanthopleuribacter pedis]|uniref:Uncharacterized protein n=1 Tax=Acanthopleuribacter pedis TaxID=442870 RepID=A0A8J7QG51_9BACT|nr:Imm51 family immunity protein [Acanthopleuribacter pedis]MBO1317978.1 hypothetical protein [Acanthopleuribacter pedis]
MYDERVALIEMPENDCISVCLYCENDDLFALGERINAKFEEAYMNGYNWDALIRCYIGKQDAQLMSEIESDPEAGMYSGYTSFSPENLEKMKRFEAYLRDMLTNETRLMTFIRAHQSEIEWD